MAANGQQQLVDGFTELSGGVNSAWPPQLLPSNQVVMGVNCSFRNSFIGPRPAFAKRALVWPDDQGATEAIWATGKFQSVGVKGAVDGLYTPVEGQSFIPVAISGHVYLVNLADYSVQDISISGDYNPPNGDQGWFCQAEQYLLYQDGVAGCFIWNGATARRADPAANEVPVGTTMGYGLGRLAVALAAPNGRQYVVGDIVGGPTDVIDFTENTFLAEGGSFSTLFHTGDISAFGFPVNLNTPLGQSLLAVYTPKGVYFNSIPFDRTTWKDLRSPIQVVALLNSGSQSPSVTNVNSDMWFRSLDGIRSLGVSVRNFGDWGDLPMSLEMSAILDFDTKRLIKFGSSCLFDNRLITTCAPIPAITTVNQTPTARGVIHKGLAVLDFFLQGSLRTKQGPCWEGLWTGLQTFGVVEGTYADESRCFVLALSQSGPIELWEILMDGDAIADNDGTADIPIQWWFTCPQYGFNAPKQFKNLAGGDMWFEDIQGTIAIAVQYRHDQAPGWQNWHSFSDCARIQDCTTLVNGCLPITPLQPQFRYFQRLPQPSDACDEIVGRPHRTGYTFQPRVLVQGFAKINCMRLLADPMAPEIMKPCLGNAPCQSVRTCPDDLFSYQL